MKTIASQLSVLAMVCGISMAWGCSSDSTAQQPGDGDVNSTPQAFSTVSGHVGNSGKDLTAFGLGEGRHPLSIGNYAH